MLSSFIIALREGLEAALIVGILIAYLVKGEKRFAQAHLAWCGTGSNGQSQFRRTPNFTSAELTDTGESYSLHHITLSRGSCDMDGFLMKRTARNLRSNLAGKWRRLSSQACPCWGSVFAVVREGLETSLFVYSNFKSVADPVNSATGLITVSPCYCFGIFDL